MSEYLDWKVGDEVVCISQGDWNLCKVDKVPAVGKKYTIRQISPARNIKETTIAIRLVELVVCSSTGQNEDYFLQAYNFRKVQKHKTDISIFKSMLNKSPEENNKELVESELKKIMEKI